MVDVAGRTRVWCLDVPGTQCERLTDVLGDTDRRRALVARGRARAQSFPWVNTAEQTLEFYRRVAARGPGGRV